MKKMLSDLAWKAPIWLLLIVATAVASADRHRSIAEQLSRSGVKGNPGLQFCLRPKLSTQLSELFGAVLDSQWPLMQPPDLLWNLTDLNGVAGVKVQRMRFVRYVKPQRHSLRFAPPDHTVWTTEKLGFSLLGRLTFDLRQSLSSSRSAGEFLFTAEDVDLVLPTEVLPGADGSARLTLRTCGVILGGVNVTSRLVGLFGSPKFLQRTVSAEPFLRRLVCHLAEHYVNAVVNPLLAAQATRVSVLGVDAHHTRLSPLSLHYGLLQPMKVYNNCLSLRASGEINWNNGDGGRPFADTPFFPHRLNFTTKLPLDHSIDAWVSDYVLNSMFYHGNQHRLFDFLFDETRTPDADARLLLRTQCQQQSSKGSKVKQLCFGAIWKQLTDRKRYPEQHVRVQWTPSTASASPYIRFNGDQTANLSIDSAVIISVRNANKTVQRLLKGMLSTESLLVNVGIQNGSVLTAEVNRTVADMRVDQFNISSSNSIKPAEKKLLEELMAELVRSIIDHLFENMIRFSQPKGLQLTNVQSLVIERTMSIAADVDFDRDYWLNEASNARIRSEQQSIER